MRRILGGLAASVAAGVVLAFAAPVSASDERPVVPPAGNYHVPAYRPPVASPHLVVCASDSERHAQNLGGSLGALNRRLLGECSYHDIQRAVDEVKQRGTTIYVLPGRYREGSSRAAPTGRCKQLAGRDVLSYEEQRACPHLQNLIGVFGDEHPGDGYDVCDGPRCDLQIEGTGAKPEDVVVEGGYGKDGSWAFRNGIRADRADGFYVRNLTTQLFGSSGIDVVQTDGFVVDRALGRWNEEYGFRAYAGDHGVYTDCEATGNGAGVATGSAADLRGARTSIEVRRCRSHDNVLGFAGTAGDSVYVHDSDLYANSVGAALDSAFLGYPGMPQNHALFVANRIHGNNVSFYRNVWDGTCARPPRSRADAVCPAMAVPVGTGVLLAGGDDNTYASNLVYDNWRYGFAQLWVPAAKRGDNNAARQRDTSHGNRYLGNLMGIMPQGGAASNGLDFWWDEQGDRNCWQNNASSWGNVRSDPARLPDCSHASGGGSYSKTGNPQKTSVVTACSSYDRRSKPPGCPWLDAPARPSR